MLLIIIGGIATAFNFIIILHKIRTKRYIDSLIDISTFVCINVIFIGTVSGMAIGMLASSIISLYLWFNPIEINLFKKDK